jgi:hypothetical protein
VAWSLQYDREIRTITSYTKIKEDFVERIRKMVLAMLLVLGLLVGFSSNSEAVPYFAIQLSDGVSNVVVEDNLNFQDLDPRSGIINWTGSVGDWSLEVQIAQTYDMLGGISTPQIDLASVNSSTAAGTLTIDVSATGFVPDSSFTSALVAIGGTTLPNGNSAITAQLFGGNSNTLFDKTNFIVGTGALVGNAAGVFGGSASSGFATTTGDFSLTSEVTIRHGASGLTTFDVNSTAVPEPFTMAFLGTCLLGAGMAGRKFKI